MVLKVQMGSLFILLVSSLGSAEYARKKRSDNIGIDDQAVKDAPEYEYTRHGKESGKQSPKEARVFPDGSLGFEESASMVEVEAYDQLAANATGGPIHSGVRSWEEGEGHGFDKCMDNANRRTEGAAKRADFIRGCNYMKAGIPEDQCTAECSRHYGNNENCCRCDSQCHQCPCAYCQGYCKNFRSTPAPTPVPTFLPPKAENDPQMRNVKGEAFAVVEKGEFTLLEIPRAHPEPVLKVLCNIQQIPSVSSSCQAFITDVTIRGSLLGALDSIGLSAATKDHAFGITLGHNGKFYSEKDLTENIVAKDLELAGVANLVSINFSKANAVHVKVGPSVLSAYRPHGNRGQDWQWLNMEFSGLAGFNKSIGGILGEDKYHPNPDPACKSHAMELLENEASVTLESFASAIL